MRRLLLLMFFSGLLIACGRKNKLPAGVLPAEKMEDVMWDVMRTDQFLTDFVFIKDSSLNKDAVSMGYYQRIFREHAITREEFQTSFKYYQKHPALLKAVMDSISTRPELKPEEIYKPVLADTAMQHKNDTVISAPGDTVSKVLPKTRLGKPQ
ncbi:MAG: DUF4296 domain-containing protein [Chitinophagaceae bacterium]|nr:DUF4296 domain-containing protein [Chitinophagaceae bacterium]